VSWIYVIPAGESRHLQELGSHHSLEEAHQERGHRLRCNNASDSEGALARTLEAFTWNDVERTTASRGNVCNPIIIQKLADAYLTVWRNQIVSSRCS
jgi:hypothetical protein